MSHSSAPRTSVGDISWGEFEKLRFYIIDVELIDSPGPTWRQLVVPRDYGLGELHVAISIAMGWSGEHVFFFRSNRTYYDDPLLIELRTTTPPAGQIHKEATRYPISKLLPRVGSKAEYVYGPGEAWTLGITAIEEIKGTQYPFSQLPVCVDGFGDYPPEELGGVEEFKRFCEVASDLSNPEAVDLLQRAGLPADEPFDPTYFPLEEVNCGLARDMVQQEQDILVPKNTRELREGYQNLLAELLAMRTSRVLAISDYLDELDERDAAADAAGPAWKAEALGPAPAATRDGAAEHGALAAALTGDAGGAGRLHVIDGGAQVSGPAPAPGRDSVSAADVEAANAQLQATAEAITRRVEANNRLLEQFQTALQQRGLSDGTIEKHVSNAMIYTCAYLLLEGVERVEDGVGMLDGFFSEFFPERYPSPSPTAASECMTAIKKFYKFLLDEGRIGRSAYDGMVAEVRACKQEWLDIAADAYYGGFH